MNPEVENGAIVDFVTAYVALSKGKRFEDKRALWDADESQPLLRPEESGSALVGWPAIDAYWSRSKETMRDLETRFWDFGVTRLADDIALVTYAQRWRAHMADASSLLSGPIASTVRVVMALRNRGSGWRVFLCVEGHVDGVEYFRSLIRT